METVDLNTTDVLVPTEAVKGNNGNIIAIAVGGAMLAVGTGIGWFLGARKGVKLGAEADKKLAAMKSDIENLEKMVAETKPAPASK